MIFPLATKIDLQIRANQPPVVAHTPPITFLLRWLVHSSLDAAYNVPFYDRQLAVNCAINVLLTPLDKVGSRL